MDVDDGFRALLEKIVEKTCEKDKWISCARWMQPAPCFRKYGCIKGMAKFPGTTATHGIIFGYWNGLPDFPETICRDSGPPRRLRA